MDASAACSRRSVLYACGDARQRRFTLIRRKPNLCRYFGEGRNLLRHSGEGRNPVVLTSHSRAGGNDNRKETQRAIWPLDFFRPLVPDLPAACLRQASGRQAGNSGLIRVSFYYFFIREAAVIHVPILFVIADYFSMWRRQDLPRRLFQLLLERSSYFAALCYLT